MTREIRLAEIIIKFEKGVKEHPVVDKGFPVIGYHCKVVRVNGEIPDIKWDKDTAHNSLITSLQVITDKLTAANSTKVAWAALSDEVKAGVLVVLYLSSVNIKPTDIKDILTALVAEDESVIKDLLDYLEHEQPHKLIKRLRRSIKSGDILSFYNY